MQVKMPFLKRIGLIFLFIVVTNSYTNAQRFDTQLNEAVRFFDSKNYTVAIQKFNLLLKYGLTTLAEKEKLSILLKLAFSYKENNESMKAENTYRQALLTSSGFVGEATKSYLHFAQVLVNNGKFQEAQKYFGLYEETQSPDKKLQEVLKDAKTNPNKGADPFSSFYPYKVEFLSFNTSRSDFSPTYYKDGIVFCTINVPNSKSSNEKGNGYWDLYYMNDISKVQKITDSEIEKRKKKTTVKNSKSGYDYRRTSNDSQRLNYHISEDGNLAHFDESELFNKILGSKNHFGPATFSHDFNKIIFTRQYVNEGKKGNVEENLNRYKLYMSENVNGKWTEAIELPFNSNEFSSSYPAWTADERLLFFASDRTGGFGGMDIWVVEYQKGIWGEPKNLGKDINSKDSEEYPFVDEKGNLYYSSNGQGTKGGFDIFFVEMNGDNHNSLPQHLSEPFNTIYDDFGIVADASRRIGYFSSNRSEGEDNDIYRFTRESANTDCHEMTINVFDSDTKNVLSNADVTILSKGGKSESKKTDNYGNLYFCTTHDTDYTIKILKEGYVPNSFGYSAYSETEVTSPKLEIPLVNAKKTNLELKISPTKKEMSRLISQSTASSKSGKRVFVGYVTREIDKQPIEGVLVTFKNICDNIVQQSYSGADGKYSFTINNDCEYTLEASKNGFSKNINRISQGNVSQDLSLFKEGDKITLDNIYYDSGSSTLRQESMRELNKLINTLSKTPSMVIELGSHTDSRGDAQDNFNLSTKRAQAAVDYIVSKGISKNRIFAKGYGESDLVNGCTNGVSCTEIEHQKNRRTTVRIIKVR